MKKITILLIASFLVSWNCGTSVVTEQPQNVITPELIQSYLSYLASDQMKGRNTPSPELDSAASFIADQFRGMGLQMVRGSYFQKVKLGFVSLGEKNNFSIKIKKKETKFAIKDDYVPFEITGSSKVQGNLIFCGYGIEAPEYKYNDYSNANVKGKVVLLLKHEPGEDDTASVFKGKEFTDYSDLSYKAKTAADKGAIGVIIVNDPLNHASLKPVGFPWPSLSKMIPKDALPLTLLKSDYKNIPIIQAGEEFIKKVFGSADKLKNLQKEIDKNCKGYSSDFKDITVSLGTSTEIKETPAYNVTAFLEGSDSLMRDEVLVIGAHYDHVGMKKNAGGQDSIFNGADDNASGTSGVLAIAKAFSQLGEKPRRSIMFITFCGEEKGLFGSRYYIDNPLFPLDKTIAMLNLDMIGRNSVDTLEIEGYSKSPELAAVNEEENKYIGFNLVYQPESSIGSSDHAPFIKKNVPAIFYFAGIHKDYHKVSDEYPLINYQKAARVSQLAFRTALRIANDTTHFKVTENSSSIYSKDYSK